MSRTSSHDALLLLVYDGDCPVCEAATRWLARRGLVAPGEVRPFQAFAGDEAARLLEAGIQRQLLLLEPATGRTVGGVPALARLFQRAGRTRTAALLATRVGAALATFLYRLVAENRRILAPPRRGVVCACDPPEPHAGWRAAFFVLWPLALVAGVAVRVTSA